MKEYLEEKFEEIQDKRFSSYIEHKLSDVLIIVMCGVLCGLDELQKIIEYAKGNIEFLQETFGITKVPSVATLSRIMNMIDGEKVANIIIEIMREALSTEGNVIAFDGKTICATAKGNREKLHIMTAYITESGVVLGQKAVNEKTNEIPTMRDILGIIDFKGKVITADAMHCQKQTSEMIHNGGGYYIWGLKGNQGLLHDEVKLYIDDCISSKDIELDIFETKEKNGGRIEKRICYKAPSINWYENLDDWEGLSCVFAVDRIFNTPNGRSSERSYYISNFDTTAEKLLTLTREHWKIESMHWQLDVTFSEDDCRVLSSNGQKTLNIFPKLSLALHKNYISTLKSNTKPSVSINLFKALVSNDTLKKVLSNSFTFL